MPLSFTPSDKGILPDRMIAALAEAGGIRAAYPFAPGQIQPASLDLRLGAVAYRVRASFLPGPGIAVARRIAELKLHEFALTEGAVLETGCVYIVPLLESLALPADIAAAANPKSSTGRLDVFTRVIADGTRGFDRVERRLSRAALCRNQPEDFPGAGARRFAAVADAIAPRRRRCSTPRRCARCMRASGSSIRAEAVMGDGVAVSVDLSGAASATRTASSAIAPSAIPR